MTVAIAVISQLCQWSGRGFRFQIFYLILSFLSTQSYICQCRNTLCDLLLVIGLVHFPAEDRNVMAVVPSWRLMLREREKKKQGVQAYSMHCFFTLRLDFMGSDIFHDIFNIIWIWRDGMFSFKKWNTKTEHGRDYWSN